MIEIKVETEKDLCGEEFLANGEVTVKPVEGYMSIVHIKGDDCDIYLDSTKLKKALDLIEEGRDL